MDIRILEFETRYSNGKAFDWVLYGPASNIKDCQTWERVDHMKPPESFENDNGGEKMFHMNAIWSVIGPAYDAWKTGNELPETGTPLKLWAGVDSGQVAVFKDQQIKTVEDVAGMSDTVMDRVNLPRIRQLKADAQAYLDSMAGSETESKITELQERLDAAMALLEEQGKPKRKRRTKAEMAAEEAA